MHEDEVERVKKKRVVRVEGEGVGEAVWWALFSLVRSAPGELEELVLAGLKEPYSLVRSAPGGLEKLVLAGLGRKW